MFSFSETDVFIVFKDFFLSRTSVYTFFNLFLINTKDEKIMEYPLFKNANFAFFYIHVSIVWKGLVSNESVTKYSF